MNHFSAASYTDAQKIAMFDRLLAGGNLDLAALADFSSTLASEVQALVGLKEPVWTNPTTGKQAASIFAQFAALGFTTSKHWSAVAKFAKGYRSYHERRDLPKRNPLWPTICLDIEDLEDMLTKFSPRNGSKVIKEFKEEHSLTS